MQHEKKFESLKSFDKKSLNKKVHLKLFGILQEIILAITLTITYDGPKRKIIFAHLFTSVTFLWPRYGLSLVIACGCLA